MNAKNTSAALIEDFDPDEIPPLTDEFFANAVHRVNFKPIGKKLKINLTLDPDVVAWYKLRAGGRGYQTLMNAALRENMREHELVETLRQVIREEMHPAS
ncbi:MAG: BrnA antitoxin family protein [Methylobacillus sp.]|jgi:uncharacterized protein (DUF4415 family)|nr:BrnA antitoxin family protein [Methylobacillus sp.]